MKITNRWCRYYGVLGDNGFWRRVWYCWHPQGPNDVVLLVRKARAKEETPYWAWWDPDSQTYNWVCTTPQAVRDFLETSWPKPPGRIVQVIVQPWPQNACGQHSTEDCYE